MADSLAVEPPTPEALAWPREFARELVRAEGQMLAYYRESEKLSLADAEVRAGGKVDVDWHERVKHEDADQVSWWGLNGLAQADPDAAQAVWERIAAEARDDLASGNRAAKALDWRSTPWERAQFIALCQSFCDQWQPRGGIESTLVDTLAQAHSGYLFWLDQLQQRATLETKDVDGKTKRDGYWVLPRVSTAEGIEQAAAMMDRFNRLFLRTLRALRDLRRYTPPVVIQSAGQVNIGERQVNIAGPA